MDNSTSDKFNFKFSQTFFLQSIKDWKVKIKYKYLILFKIKNYT